MSYIRSPRKYVVEEQDTSITVTHNLNTLSPIVQVYDIDSGPAVLFVPDNVEIINSNQLLVEIPLAITVRIVVLG